MRICLPPTLAETLIETPMWSERSSEVEGKAKRDVRVDHYHGLPVDQGAACHCGDRVDGRHAVSAAVVRLSLRGGGRIEAIRDVQSDGTAVAEGDHQSGDDLDLAGRALPRLEWPLVFVRLAARQAGAGNPAVGRPRLFFPLR